MDSSNFEDMISSSSSTFVQNEVPLLKLKEEILLIDNIGEPEVPLLNIMQENSEIEKNVQPVEGHAENQVWTFVKIFKNAKCADDFLKTEKTWSFLQKSVVEEGVRIYYKCNKFNWEGVQCPAQLYLLFHATSDAVLMYRTKSGHYHYKDE